MLSDKPYREISKDDLNFSELIGKGGQGAVYKAFWKTKQQVVAVKHVLEFNPEISVLQRIRHKHVVQFIGAVEEDHFYAIVLEYAEHGSLYQFVQTDPPDFEQLLIWSRHIALGLNYLHNGVSPRIIHRDLKSRNVLIASNRIAKICDFGSSRILDNSCTRFSKLHGTVSWMAPEVMRNSSVSEKCDTYSFAVLLWELITGKTPFEGEEEHQVMFGVCQHKRRPPIPNDCPAEFAALIRDCWEDDAALRPSVEEILLKLNAMLGNIKLTEQVDNFLNSRQSWAEEFDRQIEEIREDFQAIEKHYQEAISEKDQQLQLMKSRMAASRVAPSADRGVSSWREIDVVQWLNCNLVDLDYCNEMFEHNITGPRLLQLTEGDLLRMGVISLGHRKDILTAISDLKAKIVSIENYPPLMPPPNKPLERVRNTGSIFTICITYGNHVVGERNPKWNGYSYVEGNDIATESVKFVEFKIGNDVVKINRHPYVMENLRFDQPRKEIEMKIVFKANVIKPKSWITTFPVVLSPGGNSNEAELEICLNEEQVASSAPSVTSSLSSFSSFNVIDNWKTAPNPQGAWAVGPPTTLIQSPNNPHRSPIWRRDGSPFSHGSPVGPSPRSRRRFSSDHKLNHKLNHSTSSPGKMNQMVRRASHESRDRPRDVTLSLQENNNMGAVDKTPTHDPKNPRFTSARPSLVDDISNFQGLSINSGTDTGNISFSSLSSSGINANFSSAHSTVVSVTPKPPFEPEPPTNPSQCSPALSRRVTTVYQDGECSPALSRRVTTVYQDGEVTPKKGGAGRRARTGLSICSTLSGGSGEKGAELRDWFDATEKIPEEAKSGMDATLKRQAAVPPFKPISFATDSLNLARSGIVSYADILKCPERPAAAVSPPKERAAAAAVLQKEPRIRTISSGSNSSDNRRRGRGRGGGRGSRKRGGGTWQPTGK